MTQLLLTPFQPIRGSTAPSFSASAINSASLYAFESTGAREWQYPGSRAIRIAESSGTDFYYLIGTSDVVAVVGTCSKHLGGTVEVIGIQAGQTHISVVSSTLVSPNVTLGVGQ